MKRNFFIFVMLVLYSILYSFEDGWEARNTFDGAKKCFQVLKSELLKNPDDYEVNWKFARICHFYADNFVKSQDEKKEILNSGKRAAEKATKINPDKPEGWYWLATCLGSWGEANGIMQSLGVVKPIMEALNKGIKIDENFEGGSFFLVRGRVYHKAPPVISVGDVKKSEADYEKVLKLNPENRTAYRFYAELCIEQNRKDKAKELIEKGLSIPVNQSDVLTENKEISILKNLKEKIK